MKILNVTNSKKGAPSLLSFSYLKCENFKTGSLEFFKKLNLQTCISSSQLPIFSSYHSTDGIESFIHSTLHLPRYIYYQLMIPFQDRYFIHSGLWQLVQRFKQIFAKIFDFVEGPYQGLCLVESAYWHSFTFKNLLRHYAKQKLDCQFKGHKGQVVWLALIFKV